MRYDNATAGPGAFSTAQVPFGSWPSTFGNATTGVWRYSLYLTY